MRIENIVHKRFRPCERTYQEEIEYLQTQTTHVFRFSGAMETPEQFNVRLQQKNRLKNPAQLLEEKLNIRIDNETFMFYEMRRTTDGKWHIITCQNFDGQNPLAQEPLLPGTQIPFRTIYELTDIKEVREDGQFLKIKADVRRQDLVLFHPKVTHNFQYRDYYDLIIEIQKGICASDLFALLGCNVSEESEMAEKNQQDSADKSEIDLCRRYSYDKAGIPLTTVCIICVVMFLLTFLAFVICLVLETDVIARGICLGIGGVMILSTAISTRQMGVMKRLIQYFRDAQGNYYSIQFLKGASYTPGGTIKQNLVSEDLVKAQNREWGLFYVNRYKQGFKDYNGFSGGEAKVIAYPKLCLKSKGIKKCTYTYEVKGRTKTIRISKLYKGLCDEFMI